MRLSDQRAQSPNIVIIEIVKGSADLRSLLGAHHWAEFLKAPRKEEEHGVSSVFPCTMSTTWDLDKVGWLRRDFPQAWFKDWTPDKDK